MSALDFFNHLRLIRSQIVGTCVMHHVSNDEESSLKRYFTSDMAYYHLRWENGIETYLAIPDGQCFPNVRQIVQAYQTELARVVLGAKEVTK